MKSHSKKSCYQLRRFYWLTSYRCIFLSEGTIVENIAFGIPNQKINIDQVNKALSLAHRLKTVQKCDDIFIIDQVKVVGKGSYDELLVTNKQFKKMSNYS